MADGAATDMVVMVVMRRERGRRRRRRRRMVIARVWRLLGFLVPRARPLPLMLIRLGR
jgi:hypothetical protein